jgi:hypothetical protein
VRVVPAPVNRSSRQCSSSAVLASTRTSEPGIKPREDIARPQLFALNLKASQFRQVSHRVSSRRAATDVVGRYQRHQPIVGSSLR